MSNRATRAGVVTQGNSGGTKISHHRSNRGFSPFPVRGVTTEVTSSILTILNAGVTVVSGNVPHTSSMPTAADAVGATFILRAGSAHSHLFSGSQETGGTSVFRMYETTDGGGKVEGSALTLPGSENDSVIVQSDGIKFLVIGGSGSISGS